MEFLIIVTIGVIIVALAFLIPERDTTEQPKASQPEKPEEPGKATPTTLEGALVAQLLSCEISPVQYRIAIARLAERDDERNPLQP